LGSPSSVALSLLLLIIAAIGSRKTTLLKNIITQDLA